MTALRFVPILGILLSISLPAQTVTATLVGTVKDATGAVVPSAAVTVTQLSTNIARRAQSNESGDYSFSLLQPGSYQVTAEHEGFRKTVVSEFTLQVDQTARVDIVLQLGNVAESVEVLAAAPLVSSETSSVGQVIDQGQIVNLPLNGRNYYSLVLLAPGVTPASPNTLASRRVFPARSPASRSMSAAAGTSPILSLSMASTRSTGICRLLRSSSRSTPFRSLSCRPTPTPPSSATRQPRLTSPPGPGPISCTDLYTNFCAMTRWTPRVFRQRDRLGTRAAALQPIRRHTRRPVGDPQAF